MADSHRARLERALHCLQGLAAGDAFGERFFGPLDAVRSRIARRELPPGPWPWTDDTAMAIGVVETLAAHRGIDPDPLARRFAARYLADPARGYGASAHEMLAGIARGESWRDLARAPFGGTGSMGNGSAMRVAPIGAYFADDLEAVVEHAERSAAPTHAHPDAAAGAIAIAVAAAVAFGSEPASPASLFDEVLTRTPGGDTARGIATAAALHLDTDVSEAAAQLGNGTGVVCRDTVPLCVWLAARHLQDFTEAMWTTVSALGDRDTTCAIVGGVVAGTVGSDGLPVAFIERREPLDALGLALD